MYFILESFYFNRNSKIRSVFMFYLFISSIVSFVYYLVYLSKNKNATAKDTTGKILAYKINLSTEVKIKDVETGNQILSESFVSSSTYDVQDQYSETIKLENRSVENLINKTYQDLIIKLTKNIL